MNRSPLVSILIPLYNAQEYIGETIENCLAQTYDTIEIIIVDDGSTDNGLQIAKEYEIEYDNIKVYEQKNAGAPRARNLAFEKSSGEYIQYLDADDLMTEDKIASQMKSAETFGDTCVYSCRFEYFREVPGDDGYVWRAVDSSFDTGGEWLIAAWRGAWTGVVMSWLTARKLIEKAGPWDETLKKNQDGEFFSRVLINAEKVIFSEEAIVYYRKTGTTSVASQFSESSARSTLETYKLYEIHTEALTYPDLDQALAYNYLGFIRSYYPHFPLLLREAEDAIYRLGFNYHTLPIPGKLGIPSKMLGSKNIIKILYMFRKIRGKVS